MPTYRLAEPTTQTVHTDPLTNQLLINRDVTNEVIAEEFLFPDYDKHRHDPFLLPGIDAAVARILSAISNNERIAIYADYDCDGIPGAVVLSDFFAAIEYSNVRTYIPHRHFEGFGLHAEAVEKLKADAVDLIITIDCGTASVAAVARAAELGVDVVITDHHEPGETIPAAVAIVNPKVAPSYPFTELCGAGVIFKVVEALLQKGDFTLTAGREKWWLDMVGVATINDMVPLQGENRVLAHFGLRVLRQSRRPGLQQLLRKARASQSHLTEDDVGFTIGPRINAASRMDTPEDAFALLTATDTSSAGAHVEHLEKLNNERKGLVASMSKELKKRVAQLETIPPVIVLGNPEWRPALVGLA
ncbi:MAG: DHH family phosphoesterase, partial [Bacteroidota bacterium]